MVSIGYRAASTTTPAVAPDTAPTVSSRTHQSISTMRRFQISFTVLESESLQEITMSYHIHLVRELQPSVSPKPK
jgi:hypothetical protein